MGVNQIEEVKSKTDIVSLLSEYIELKKAGRNYKANCPFHGEKTPSFMVSSELQLYKCFGCGKSGDVFTFLEEHEGMEFGEALKYLADRAGIKLIVTTNTSSSEKEKIIEINKAALNFYQYVLLQHPSGKKVLKYLLEDRGLSMEMIKLFKIGYSPDNYNALSNYLITKKKFKIDDLKISGLFVGRNIDRFKGRVIFPLTDHRDNIIAFAGRVLPWADKNQAKYINSPDTPLYHKSMILYGLNLTKGHIRDQKKVVIVEGEIDMISSFSAGVKNVVAIKGSALTEDQIRLLGRFLPLQSDKKEIILCLDSDFAGNEAAKRGAIIASNLGYEIKVVEIQGYKDPDEIARNDPEKYKQEIENALPIWDFIINSSIKKYGLSDGEAKKKVSNETVPLFAQISDEIMKAHYVELLARKLSVPYDAVFAEIEKIKAHQNLNLTDQFQNKQKKTRRQVLEDKLVATCLSENTKEIFDDQIKHLIKNPLLIKIINYLSNQKPPLPAELSDKYSEILLENSEKEDVNLLIKELKVLSVKERLEEISNLIKSDETNENLIKEFSDLSKTLSEL